MRILFINYEFPPIGGGGGRATWQITRRLATRGHEVELLTSRFRNLPESEVLEGVQIHRIRVRRKRPDRCAPGELLYFILRSISATKKLAAGFGPDVVCAFFAVPGGPAAWRLWRRLKIPYVLALRGSDVPRPQLAKHQRLHAVIRPFIRRMLHDAAAVTAVSVGLRDAALALAPRLELEVIPNGVDTRLFVSRSAPADAAELNQLLFVGRLREFKGVQYIINALAAVERGLKRSVRLTIVGDGPHKSRLMNLARKLRTTGVQSEVRFLGWIEPAAVRDIYAASSVVVLPSLVEGHPNVLLEGMACGLPCVASDVPGTREVMTQDCGVLVPPEDSESMAAAIVSVLGRMDDWRKMGRAARVRAEAFSWDAVADRYELLLRKVVESRA